MNRFTPILTAILIAVMATLAAAQKPAATNINGRDLFALEDLRPGMKGTALQGGAQTQSAWYLESLYLDRVLRRSL